MRVVGVFLIVSWNLLCLTFKNTHFTFVQSFTHNLFDGGKVWLRSFPELNCHPIPKLSHMIILGWRTGQSPSKKLVLFFLVSGSFAQSVQWACLSFPTGKLRTFALYELCIFFRGNFKKSKYFAWTVIRF